MSAIPFAIHSPSHPKNEVAAAYKKLIRQAKKGETLEIHRSLDPTIMEDLATALRRGVNITVFGGNPKNDKGIKDLKGVAKETIANGKFNHKKFTGPKRYLGLGECKLYGDSSLSNHDDSLVFMTQG